MQVILIPALLFWMNFACTIVSQVPFVTSYCHSACYVFIVSYPKKNNNIIAL